jgi:hypothetical protein
MIAVIHQPYLLPWMGYFSKLAYANNYIALDDVQYCVRYYHNRTLLKSLKGDRMWITLPVGQGHFRSKISDVNVIEWERVLSSFDKIRTNYAGSKYCKHYWPEIQECIEMEYPSLVRINVGCIKTLLKILGFEHVKVSYASDYYLGEDRTERLINICQATNSDGLIMGPESWLCHDIEKIHNKNIRLYRHEFINKHPIYPQHGNSFIPGLSVLDALFEVGPEQTRKMILDTWSPDGIF